jgi:hypothetical protein
MSFITLGADEAQAQTGSERMGPLAKLLAGVAIAGGAVVALKHGRSRSSAPRFSDDWSDGMTTKRLPRESMQKVVFGRLR